MNFHNPFSTLVWMFIIVKLNVSFVVSKIVPFQKGDARDWRETGDNANLAKFNNLHSIIIDEEKLSESDYYSGKCDSLDWVGFINAINLEYPNQCSGLLVHCWFHEESQRRKDAQTRYDSVKYYDAQIASLTRSGSDTKAVREAKNQVYRMGNTCKCLCNRHWDNGLDDKRGQLLDFICLDPVSVDEDHVATGVRFKRHDNVIYLELQQAKLLNNRIVTTPKWNTTNDCQKSAAVASPSPWGWDRRFSILTEDIVLSEDAVLTGVTFGESVRGRYINENGNFDTNREEFTEASQCVNNKCPDDFNEKCKIGKRPSLRDANDRDENPRVSTGTKDNYERSEPCKSRIFFRETSATENDMENIVPYVDLQEIVTEPPEPIHGVGWYLRGFPGYGGFLALKIFKKV